MTTNPNVFTLHYLDVRARAEPIRLILHYGGIPYEDHIIRRADWVNGVKQEKRIAPFGQVPSITLPNGEVIAQTGAIIRIVAKLANIYPSDIIEAGKADMLFEKIVDMGLINPILNVYPVGSEQFQTNYDTFFQSLPVHLQSLTDLLKEGPYFGGESLHYGDLAVFHILLQCKTVNGNALNGFPKLEEFVERISRIPSIANYLESRPKGKDYGFPGSFIQTLN